MITLTKGKFINLKQENFKKNNLLDKNRIKTKPPKTANGTVSIIINGWTKELNVAAITLLLLSVDQL